MLNLEDGEPTIRWAIIKRLDKEPGIRTCEVLCEEHKDSNGQKAIAVGVLVLIDDGLVARSRFDLPWEFSHSHLINEIDQMCEQYKAARADFWGRGRPNVTEHILAGTGTRGLWPKEEISRTNH